MKNLTLHAIIMKKPFYTSKQNALSEARKRFPTENIPGFVRETSTSYRVRCVPKTKFIKTSYVSKPITSDITFIFGKLK